MKIQFIKNYFTFYNKKQFRKYNIIKAIYSEVFESYFHYTKYSIYIIPKEYVKEYKKGLRN